MARARLQIVGKVQGVSYRHFAQKQGKLLKLTGWIKNLADGSVLAEVEGSFSNIDDFITWCKQGPPNARVLLVEVDWLNSINDNIYRTTSFEIL